MDSNNLFVKVSIQDLVKIGIQKDVIGQLVSEYEFGERSIYDLYAKPLLVTVRDVLEILITWEEVEASTRFYIIWLSSRDTLKRLLRISSKLTSIF